MFISGFMTSVLCVLSNSFSSVDKGHCTGHQLSSSKSHNSVQTPQRATTHNAGTCLAAHPHGGPEASSGLAGRPWSFRTSAMLLMTIAMMIP